MPDDKSFDPASLGLPSHYSQDQRRRIQQYLVEDFQHCGYKMPTYTNLLARFIQADGVPESWLERLKHQTIVKIIRDTATPHYEVWACLHLYLRRKYGDTIHIDRDVSVYEKLGHAMVGLGGAGDLGSGGAFIVKGEPAMAISLRPNGEPAFALIDALVTQPAKDEFSDSIRVSLRGAGVRSGDRLIALLQETGTRALITLDYHMSVFDALNDQEMLQHLRAMGDDE